jgi:hypothetical protein
VGCSSRPCPSLPSLRTSSAAGPGGSGERAGAQLRGHLARSDSCPAICAAQDASLPPPLTSGPAGMRAGPPAILLDRSAGDERPRPPWRAAFIHAAKPHPYRPHRHQSCIPAAPPHERARGHAGGAPGNPARSECGRRASGPAHRSCRHASKSFFARHIDSEREKAEAEASGSSGSDDTEDENIGTEFTKNHFRGAWITYLSTRMQFAFL